MSSGSYRDAPTGVIHQGNKVVGCIVMPEAEEVFIREFNHCYGQMRMSVAAVTPDPTSKTATTDPHTFQIPSWFRHVWLAAQSLEEPLESPRPIRNSHRSTDRGE